MGMISSKFPFKKMHSYGVQVWWDFRRMSFRSKRTTPPSDAVVLFDGKDLSKWAHKDGSPAKWKVENGYFEVVPKTGYIYTREAFGDCQLHVEFSEPSPAKGESQDRANSGAFLQCLYEPQLLTPSQPTTYTTA